VTVSPTAYQVAMAAGDLLLLSSALLFGVRPEQPRLGRRATQRSS
jgi:hypothetical protein